MPTKNEKSVGQGQTGDSAKCEGAFTQEYDPRLAILAVSPPSDGQWWGWVLLLLTCNQIGKPRVCNKAVHVRCYKEMCVIWT